MAARYWQHPNASHRALRWGVVALVVAGVGAYLVYKAGLGTGAAMGAAVALIASACVVGEKLWPLLVWWRKRGAPVPAPTPADVGTAKDILAGLVAQQRFEETALRSLGDPAPMPVPWSSTERR
ncbi:hypothetical protein [Nonomuraea fuscirosea]|uniref:hypothetical protein n=1 Tax=Nonomuraea fuscirosea TaxID=1291556 RepID=UPI0034155BD3